MIALQNIHKAFGKQKVLAGVDLQVEKQKITVIIGRSGEGKSVLLKTALGLLVPDEGKVLIDDVDLFALSHREQNDFRKKFGMLFQHAALFDSMNVYENIAFPLREHTEMEEDEIAQSVKDILTRVGLSKIEKKMPAELSGGMRKRVGLARALMLKPEYILYDEPTTGLDPILTDSIDELICQTHRESKIAALIVSHDIPAAFKMADCIAMLHEGKIVVQGRPDEIRACEHPFVQEFLKSSNII